MSRPRSGILWRYLTLFAVIDFPLGVSSVENTGTYLMKRAIDADASRAVMLREVRGDTLRGRHGMHIRQSGRGYWCDNVVYDVITGRLLFYSRILGSRMCR